MVRFLLSLNQAANGDERMLQELLSVLIHRGRVAPTLRNKSCLKKLARTGIVRAESIRPNSRRKVYILMPDYRAVLQGLNACDLGERLMASAR